MKNLLPKQRLARTCVLSRSYTTTTMTTMTTTMTTTTMTTTATTMTTTMTMTMTTTTTIMRFGDDLFLPYDPKP
eukprot:1475963-Amphidinium_carterae.1